MAIIYYIPVTSRKTAIEALPEHQTPNLPGWDQMNLSQQKATIKYLRRKIDRINLRANGNDRLNQQIQRIKAIISYLE